MKNLQIKFQFKLNVKSIQIIVTQESLHLKV